MNNNFHTAPIPRTKIFLDTEFTGLHRHASLISIGMVAENGWYFYGEFSDYDHDQITPWIKENVIPNLTLKSLTKEEMITDDTHVLILGNRTEIAAAIRQWISQFGAKKSVEVWADVLAWDWVLFCDLFGTAFDLPEQVHYIPRDLSTLLVLKGVDPDITREELGQVHFQYPQLHLSKHHALYDALLEQNIFEKLSETTDK